MKTLQEIDSDLDDIQSHNILTEYLRDGDTWKSRFCITTKNSLFCKGNTTNSIDDDAPGLNDMDMKDTDIMKPINGIFIKKKRTPRIITYVYCR